jgi:hypothetical protein
VKRAGGGSGRAEDECAGAGTNAPVLGRSRGGDAMTQLDLREPLDEGADPVVVVSSRSRADPVVGRRRRAQEHGNDGGPYARTGICWVNGRRRPATTRPTLCRAKEGDGGDLDLGAAEEGEDTGGQNRVRRCICTMTRRKRRENEM